MDRPFVSPLAVVILSLLVLQPARTQPVTKDILFSWVEGISGRDHDGRRQFVRDEVKGLGLLCAEYPFDTTFSRRDAKISISGVNLVATIGTGHDIVVVGAHYDAVPGSPGANDDGAGVAILLGLLSSLKDTTLGLTVRICFFDQEEAGLIGSSVYAREHRDPQRHLAMINLDVVGFGSELFVGPLGDGDNDLIAPLITDIAGEHGIPWNVAHLYPPGDNLSFAHEGLENISVAIVPAGDSQRVQRMLNGKATKETMPIVMKTMHTPKDDVDTIEPEAMLKVLTLIREAVLRVQERR